MSLAIDIFYIGVGKKGLRRFWALQLWADFLRKFADLFICSGGLRVGGSRQG